MFKLNPVKPEAHSEILYKYDKIYGGMVGFTAAIMCITSIMGQPQWEAIGVLIVYGLANLVASEMSRRSPQPYYVEFFRLLFIGTPVLIYFVSIPHAPISPVWMVVVIQIISSAVMIYTLTKSKTAALLQQVWWMGIVYLGTPTIGDVQLDIGPMIHYTSLVIMQGLLFVELTHLLTLSKDRERETQAMVSQTGKMSALGEMAGGIAHEINNPLAIISTSSGILQEVLKVEGEVDRNTALKLSEKIEKVTHRIAKIISGLKTFSRDPSKDPMEVVCARDLIESTLDFCLQKFKSNGVELIYDPPPEEIKFEAQSVAISQVLLNLLNNAYDAIEDSSDQWIKINLGFDDNHVFIHVIDSGPGIPADMRQKIFQPFYTTKEIGKGTGIGLSISASIAKANGGSLTLDESNKNTCFVIQLKRTHQDMIGKEQTKEAS